MYTEALAGQHAAVLWFLHQEANLSQQAVQETGQHRCAPNHHEVLRQHFTGVNGALGIRTYTQISHLTDSLSKCLKKHKAHLASSVILWRLKAVYNMLV